jgi:hypothetical protein
VSGDCCTTSIYYEPPLVHPDPGWDIPWLLVVPLIVFIGALIWLNSLSTPIKEKKTPRQRINEAIDKLTENATLFDRKEAANVLQKVRIQINEIIDKD